MTSLCITGDCPHTISEDRRCPVCGSEMLVIRSPTGEEIARIVADAITRHGPQSTIAALSLAAAQCDRELSEHLAMASECVADAILLVFACELEQRRRMI